MTFGQTLKQILSSGGVRLTHFANNLGYDSSYVSRWINDIKTPSLKNNSELFSKVAETIISCCTESGLEQLYQQYCPGGAGDLCSVLTTLLQDSYNNLDKAEPVAPYVERNALYSPGSGSANFGHKVFHDAFQAAADASERGIVECICGSRLSLNGNTAVGFFSAVLPEKDSKNRFRIMIHQLVDIRDFEQNVDTCCAAICTFTRFEPDVIYTFYEYDSRQHPVLFESYMLIEDSLMQCSFKNPLTERIDTFISFDNAANNNEFLSLKSKLAFMRKILKFCTREDMKDEYQFLYNYVMDGGIRYFLDFMQPIYMPSALSKKLGAKYFSELDPDGFMYHYNSICAQSDKEVILYRSALLNYIYNGEIFIYGRVVSLSTEERIEHLERLTENIASGKCRITILSDINPLLNHEDTKLSFFLSCKSGFMVAVGDTETPIIRFRAVQTVEHFNEFFSHILNLDSNYITSGKQSLDFIKRGLDILKSGE